MTKLKFTLRAVHDLRRLREFIAEHNPDAAKCMSQRLKQRIHHLVENPKLSKVLDEPPGVRDYVAGSYLVRYTVQQDTVINLKIWHGKEER